MINELLPLCYGRLNMRPDEIRKAYIADIALMAEGWKRRYYDQQDLFIIYGALPIFQVNCKNPPRYEDFIKNRNENNNGFGDFNLEELEYFAQEE